ncbi:MAG TPA: M56 family metallopeptidase [Thermoanaerobaculia bacterium]
MNSEILSGPMVQAIGWALVHLLWQGALVAAVLGATLSVVSRNRSNLRYLISCGALMLMLVLGIATAWKTYEEPATRAFPLAQWTSNAFDAGDMVLGVATAPTWRERVAVVTTMARAWLPQIVLTWLIGVALLSARLLVSWLRAHQLARRNAVPATDEWQRTMRRLAEALKLRRAVRLLESAAVEVPTVVGWMRPVVLLPASTLTGLSPEQIEMILAHELAHIRRHDFFVNLLQAMVETLMFYHPAVWWMSRQVRIERENCCDDLAVAVCGNALQYARALTRLEELRTAPMQTVLAANGGSLIERIRRLVGVRAEASLGAPRWAAGLAGVTVLLLIATGPSLLAQREEKQKAKEETKSATSTVEVSAERLRERSAVDRVERDEDEGEDAGDDDDIYVDIEAPEPPETPDVPEIPEIEMVPEVPMAPPAPGTMAFANPTVHVDIAPMAPIAPIVPRVAVSIAPAAIAAALAGIDEDAMMEEREERTRERSRDKGKMGADGKLSIDDLVTLRVHGVTPWMRKAIMSSYLRFP